MTNYPLHDAVSLPSLEECAKLLAEGVDVNGRDQRGDTALHHACVLSGPESAEVVRMLLLAGADVDAVNDRGRRPHFGVRTIPALRLLAHFGADLNAVDANGRTLLVYRGRNSERAMVLELLALGAEITWTASIPRQHMHEVLFVTGKPWTEEEAQQVTHRGAMTRALDYASHRAAARMGMVSGRRALPWCAQWEELVNFTRGPDRAVMAVDGHGYRVHAFVQMIDEYRRRLPTHTNSAGFVERVWSSPWESFPPLPDHLRRVRPVL